MIDEREIKRLKEAEEKLNALLAAASTPGGGDQAAVQKTVPIKISSDENEGKDEALLHQV